MRTTRLLSAIVTGILIAIMIWRPVAAQYTVGLPATVASIQVEGQPMDPDGTIPVSETTLPQIDGIMLTGQPTVDLAIDVGVNGASKIERFTVKLDNQGRFSFTPPDPLTPNNPFAVYLDDAYVGYFSIAPDAKTPNLRQNANGDAQNDNQNRNKIAPLDIARLVPFPADFGDAIPGLGLLEGRFYTIDDEAERTAASRNDTSKENVQQIRDGLANNGWQQRYEVRLAAPNQSDPSKFDQQVTSFVIEYETADQAQAAFAASTNGADTVDGTTIGDESEYALLTGTTPDTNAPYQALRLLYRQDRLLGMVILANLLNDAPDQAALEAAATAVSQRASAVLAGETLGEAPRALRPDVPNNANSVNYDEAYDVVDGQIVALYNEDAATTQARLATYTGTTEDYTSAITGQLGGDANTAGKAFSFSTMLLAFPSSDDADTWMQSLTDRISNDPLRGYLSFAEVQSAPLFGDNSATYSFQRQISDQAISGYRIYAQLGQEVAVVEYSNADGASIDDIAGLVNAQLDCLKNGVCAKNVSLPGGGGRANRGNQGATNATPTAVTTATAIPTPTSGQGGVKDVPADGSTNANPANNNGNGNDANNGANTDKKDRADRKNNRQNNGNGTNQDQNQNQDNAGQQTDNGGADKTSTGGAIDLGPNLNVTGTPAAGSPAPTPTPTPEAGQTQGGVRDVTPSP